MTNEPRRRGPGSRDPRVWQHHMRQGCAGKRIERQPKKKKKKKVSILRFISPRRIPIFYGKGEIIILFLLILKLSDSEKIERSEMGRLRTGMRVDPRLRRWTKWRLPFWPASFSCREVDLFLIVLDAGKWGEGERENKRSV
ncbi:hypothetical protein CDAR_480861 [Caerostris darwini]|uniref:Uncharacterized protein n=1 Tax=Caerostris darwini TaxID=1538125 RepID=A0AAV4RYB3_9ARAC|nr:hypothetical protein CDAR_480861 [Caerostris darwini]